MNRPIIFEGGRVQKPIVRNQHGHRQCTRCFEFKPEVRYARELKSDLGRARICISCKCGRDDEVPQPSDSVDGLPVQEIGTSPVGLSGPLYADPDPNPPPRLVLLGPFAGPIRPTPQPRSKLQHCAYRNHWRPAADFQAMYTGKLVTYKKCVACRDYCQRAKLAEAASLS